MISIQCDCGNNGNKLKVKVNYNCQRVEIECLSCGHTRLINLTKKEEKKNEL